MNAFVRTLEEYGADTSALRFFDRNSPDLLPYATLTAARNAGDYDLAALVGVYEWQDTPLVYLLDGERIQGNPDDVERRLRRLRRIVALQGDVPYLGVVEAGRLTVYRVGLDARQIAKTRLVLEEDEKQITFAYLANEQPGMAQSQRRWISDIVLKLLDDSITQLKTQLEDTGLTKADALSNALSLVGRALFVRFLGDRGLMPQEMENIETLFATAEQAETTSYWLDQTFNGDFLSLSRGIFARLPAEACHSLGNILHRANPNGQLSLGWKEKWDHLDFSHIPVGVLSQAYEQHMRKYAPKDQRNQGSYYTPPLIASLMVRGAFRTLQREDKAHDACVLDPATGAGVFLLASFRQLVAERWRHDGKRPDTRTLREMLYTQITGFDINEQALRFAALGLYLISIELDPDPQPVEKLRFQNLRERVLHKVSEKEEGSLGSLGPQIGKEHTGRYDLVIGNPPWASRTKLEDWPDVVKIVKEIAKKRLGDQTPIKLLPQESLDLPFIWRAMDWAKEGGAIVFALHARLLFQSGMADARSAIFSALDVTGLVNGSELRHSSQIWPNIDAPFCLMFAKNQRPDLGSGFRFVTPRLEHGLNGNGWMRIDAVNAAIVTSEQIACQPEILKILFRGGILDLEVYERTRGENLDTLSSFWKKMFGTARGHLRHTGKGYQRINKATKPPKPADYLFNIKTLPESGLSNVLLNTTSFSLFEKLGLIFLHRNTDPDIFCAPLLIVHKSPPAKTRRLRVAVTYDDVVFNESFYGYSAHDHADGQRLVRYLALMVGSRPALWHVLMSSGEFGVEREVVEKKLIEEIPIIPFDNLAADDLEWIDTLFDALVRNDTEETWKKIDSWVARLYGMQEGDLDVIDDTLRFNLPFADNRKQAQLPPNHEEINIFCKALMSELSPWLGGEFGIFPVPTPSLSPWKNVCIRKKENIENELLLTTLKDDNLWQEIVLTADKTAATEIIVPDEEQKCLWLGRLNQARYWSRSQARFVARQVIWQHLDVLLGAEAS